MRGFDDLDRRILAVAAPAFVALVTEPLMLLADTAIIGHLGTTELGGLAAASVVLTTVVGLCVFLAYGSTAAVARRHGAGREAEAYGLAVGGLWLALGLGVVLGLGTALASGAMSRALSSSAPVAAQADRYLVISAAAVPAMLVVLAATGALRGVLDLRTPLVVAAVANVLNVVLNLVLVYGFDLGIGGAAAGTVIAQWVAALWLGVVVVRRAAAARASVRQQVATSVVTFLAFGLDAIAIAGQALTGRTLGAGDAAGTRALTRRMVAWGIGTGLVAAVVLAAGSPLLARMFSPDPAVQDALVPALLVVALIQPVSGVVFVLDGVLIGAGDGPYLAWVGLAVLAVYAPCALAVGALDASFTWLWVAYGAFIAARLVTLWLRQRGDRWMVLGA
jgi:Na+-driven multidrug efflux pump